MWSHSARIAGSIEPLPNYKKRLSKREYKWPPISSVTQPRPFLLASLSHTRLGMTETLEHPLSGRNKGWAVPDFSLEARKLKRTAATTLPVGQFHLGNPAALPHRHPDEEKGRSLRTNSRSASTSGLFASSDSANRRSWFDSTAESTQVIQPPPLGLAPAAQITGDNNDDDDDDDALFESWHRDGGARALPDEVADDDFARAPSRSTERPALAWVPSSWTTAVDKAVMNANGCIQLRYGSFTRGFG